MVEADFCYIFNLHVQHPRRLFWIIGDLLIKVRRRLRGRVFKFRACARKTHTRNRPRTPIRRSFLKLTLLPSPFSINEGRKSIEAGEAFFTQTNYSHPTPQHLPHDIHSTRADFWVLATNINICSKGTVDTEHNSFSFGRQHGQIAVYPGMVTPKHTQTHKKTLLYRTLISTSD